MIFRLRAWLARRRLDRACARGDHVIVSVIELIEGRLVYTRDYCSHCNWKSPRIPGQMVPWHAARLGMKW